MTKTVHGICVNYRAAGNCIHPSALRYNDDKSLCAHEVAHYTHTPPSANKTVLLLLLTIRHCCGSGFSASFWCVPEILLIWEVPTAHALHIGSWRSHRSDAVLLLMWTKGRVTSSMAHNFLRDHNPTLS